MTLSPGTGLSPEHQPLIHRKLLREYCQFLETRNDASLIHLKVDTGMHRLGFRQSDLPELLEALKNNRKIKIQSAFTHLAAADDARFNEFTAHQLTVFRNVADEIQNQVGYKFIRHSLNSAGIVRFPDRQMDMVRLGIGLYGVEANALLQDKLLPVGTLKAVISQIKEVAPGETVGYSRRGVSQDNRMTSC